MDDLAKTVSLEETTDIVKILEGLDLDKDLRVCVENWLKEYPRK